MTFPSTCPVADVYEWLPDRLTGGPMTVTRGLVLHVNEGNGDPFNWWTLPSTPTASSHFQCMKDGRLIQYTPLNVVAWCQVAGSTMWHSVETEGFATEPLTAAQVAKLAKLYAWGMGALGWAGQLADSPAGVGLGIHSMGGEAWGGHACPGTIRAGQRAAILSAATKGADVAIPLPTLNGADKTHPRSLALAKQLLDDINPAASVLKTDAAFVAGIKAFQGFFHIPGGADGIVGQATWAALLYIASGGAK